jgi:hypothetical protein
MSKQITNDRQRESAHPRRRRIRGFVRRHPAASAICAVLAVGFVVFVLLWFEPQKAFIDQRVDEALPGAAASAPLSAGDPSTPAPSPSASSPVTVTPAPSEPAIATLARGSFRSLEHGTTGTALLLELPDGSHVLRFEDLDTLNGPDLRVYLSELGSDLGMHDYGERFVDLGGLKGNQGNQNYDIPSDLDVSRYRSAVIWCRRFSVGFGVAPLDR